MLCYRGRGSLNEDVSHNSEATHVSPVVGKMTQHNSQLFDVNKVVANASKHSREGSDQYLTGSVRWFKRLLGSDKNYEMMYKTDFFSQMN